MLGVRIRRKAPPNQANDIFSGISDNKKVKKQGVRNLLEMLKNIKKNIIENRKYEAIILKKDSKKKPRVSLLEQVTIVGEEGERRGNLENSRIVEDGESIEEEYDNYAGEGKKRQGKFWGERIVGSDFYLQVEMEKTPKSKEVKEIGRVRQVSGPVKKHDSTAIGQLVGGLIAPGVKSPVTRAGLRFSKPKKSVKSRRGTKTELSNGLDADQSMSICEQKL
jgi:hypothetical protein